VDKSSLHKCTRRHRESTTLFGRHRIAVTNQRGGIVLVVTHLGPYPVGKEINDAPLPQMEHGCLV